MKLVTLLNVMLMDSEKYSIKLLNVTIVSTYVVKEIYVTKMQKHLVHHYVSNKLVIYFVSKTNFSIDSKSNTKTRSKSLLSM